MKIKLFGIFLILINFSLISNAQEPSNYKSSFNIGATLTDGNSETTQLNASLLTEGEKDMLGSFRAGAEMQYGENTVDGEKTKNLDNGKIFGNAKKTITELTFAYLDTSALYDDIKLIDYRAAIGPGLGYYFIKDKKTALSAEAGISYIWEKVDGIKDDYAALRIAERLDHAFSSTAKIWQSAEYLPQINDFQNYLLNSEIGAEAALNESINLRIVLQDKFDNQPAPGLEKNDLSLIAGVGFSF